MNPDQIELAKGITIATYRKYEQAENRDPIADLIWQRFAERYIAPVETGTRHGFCIMAVSCLMIESLESFYRGWPTTNRQSEQAFCSFFDRSELFKDFRGHAQDFYKHIRCGILHQGETTGGWRIWRKGPLVDYHAKTINATTFLKTLRVCLENYRKELRGSGWNSAVWQNCRKKMKVICDNCKSN